MVYPLVSSNMAGWKILELHGGLQLGKSSIKVGFSSQPCLTTGEPEGMVCEITRTEDFPIVERMGHKGT